MRKRHASPIDPDYPTRNSPQRRAGLSRRSFLRSGTTSAIALGAVASLAGKKRRRRKRRRKKNEEEKNGEKRRMKKRKRGGE